MAAFPEGSPHLLVLCRLESFRPMKVEEEDLRAFLAKEGMEGRLNAVLTELLDEGLISSEETVPPFQTIKKRRYGITEKGREAHRQAKGDSAECINPREIESRLISSYDSVKHEMEGIRQDLERDQKVMGEEMAKMSRSIADHDQFLKTYFVRIMESIGVFIGVFGIVVVMMVTNLKDSLYGPETDVATYLAFSVTLPLLLAITMLPGMWLVKRLILDPEL